MDIFMDIWNPRSNDIPIFAKMSKNGDMEINMSQHANPYNNNHTIMHVMYMGLYG